MRNLLAVALIMLSTAASAEWLLLDGTNAAQIALRDESGIVRTCYFEQALAQVEDRTANPLRLNYISVSMFCDLPPTPPAPPADPCTLSPPASWCPNSPPMPAPVAGWGAVPK